LKDLFYQFMTQTSSAPDIKTYYVFTLEA